MKDLTSGTYGSITSILDDARDIINTPGIPLGKDGRIQFSLFPDDGVPRARVETSYRAAVAVAPVVTGRRLAVLELFRAAGARGLTDPEIAAAMGLPLQSAVPLRHWLAGRDLIVRAWVTRENEHGKKCNVWRIN